jgi:hypothetical protein
LALILIKAAPAAEAPFRNTRRSASVGDAEVDT